MMHTSTTKIMKARRKGFCGYCGKEFGIDSLFKWDFQLYMGFCPECPNTPNQNVLQSHRSEVTIRQDVADLKIKTELPNIPGELVPELVNLFDGKITIPFRLSDQGRRHHVTLWIKTRSKNSQYPGSRRIRLFHGRDNDQEGSYIDVAYITVSGKLVFLDSFFGRDARSSDTKVKVVKYAINMLVNGIPEEEYISYGINYAMLSRKCWRCGRKLTNPDTLELASKCGPICDKFVAKHVDITKLQKAEPKVFRI